MRLLMLLPLFLFAFSLTLAAQKNKDKEDKEKARDFIINNSGDTIRGRIGGNLTPANASGRVTFTNDDGAKTVYKPYQIKSWHPAGLNYYFESKEYRPKGMKAEEQGYGVFMKCFTPYEGGVRHYEYYNTDGQEGYYQTFLERSGQMVEVKYERFYAQLAEYFSDYSELAEKIKDKKYKKSQLSEIVDEYNRWKNRKV